MENELGEEVPKDLTDAPSSYDEGIPLTETDETTDLEKEDEQIVAEQNE